jgi:tetratricopeptide (TPR) repeat protein
VAFAAALLWSLHPLLTESVTYVVQRAESLMALWYLLVLYAFIRSTAAGARRRAWEALSVAACLLGMATKEVMVTAPVVVLLYDRAFVAGGFRAAWARRAGYYLALAGTWLLLAVLVLTTHGRGGTAGFGSGVSPSDYALTQAWAIPHYLRLALWPHPLVFDYGRVLVTDPARLVVPVLVLAGLVGAALWALRRRPPLGFLGAAFFLILAPSSSLVPVATETVAEHRMYLPLVAVAVLSALALDRALRRAALPVAVAWAALLGVLTWERNRVYGSAESLWADTVAHEPGNERAHNNLGFILAAEPGRADAAEAQYAAALRIDPAYAQAQCNLGLLLVSQPGRLDEAIRHFQAALRVDPHFVDALYNLGCAFDQVPGRGPDAVALYQEAIRLKPDHYQAHFNLGCALDRLPGQRAAAMAQYAETIRLRPDFAEAHYNLGGDLQLEPGRTDEAIAQYREALRLDPGYAEAHHNLGVIYQLMAGRADEAIAEYREALRLKPDFAQAHFNLAYVLDSRPGGRDEAIEHYREAIRLNPGYAEAHYDLGCDLGRLPGGRGEAIAQFRAALALKPDYVAAMCNLGNALNAEGQVEEAVDQYENALRRSPDDPLIHLNLAVILVNGGMRRDEAIRHLQETLRLQPGNPIAQRLLARIEGG